MDCTPLIVVQDVPASGRWYRSLVGLESGHGGDEFEMLMGDGHLLLMLHHRKTAEHPAVDPPGSEPGSGVLLYFTVDDLDAAFARASSMNAAVLDEPHLNEASRSREFSVRDPDGYGITLSQWAG